MKLLTLIIPILLFLSSCSHTKNLHKTDTKVKSDSIVNSISVTTSTEMTVGQLKVIGDTLTKEVDFDNLKEDPIDFENDNLRLILTKDKITHKIKATAIQKPKVIPIKTIRVTENKTLTNAEVKKQSDVKTKDVDKKVTGGFNLNWLWLILVLVLIFLAWRYGLFNKKPTG